MPPLPRSNFRLPTTATVETIEGNRGQVFHVPARWRRRPVSLGARPLKHVCRFCAISLRSGSRLLETATVETIARAPRIEVENGIYHVVARGNERKAIYRDAADRERLLEILRLTGERCCWLALAYCLMGNHYHLLVETQKPNLAKGVRQLNGVHGWNVEDLTPYASSPTANCEVLRRRAS